MRTSNIIEAVAEGINSKIANKEEESFEAIAAAKNSTDAIYWARHQAHADQVSAVQSEIQAKMEAFGVSINDTETLMDAMVESITRDGEEFGLTIEYITLKKKEFQVFVGERDREVSDILQAYQDSFVFTSSN